MRRQLLMLAALFGYSFSVPTETVAAGPEGTPNPMNGALANAIITYTNNPEYTRTDASGTFNAQISLVGKVTDKTALHNGISGVAISIPYYGKELTAATDSAGKFTTNTIAFSGTVVNDGDEPIANAWVSFQRKVTLLKDTSDSNGAFNNGGRVGVRTPYALCQMNEGGASLKGNRLTVALSTNQTIDLSLFTITGRQVFANLIDNLSDREQRMKLPELSAGFYLLRVTAGTSTTTFKQVFLSKQVLLIQRVSISANKPATASKKSASSVVDTLVALAEGYLMGNSAVPADATSGLKITLTASKQWKPISGGELEHQGNMVKIKAQGHNFSMGQPVMITEDFDQISWEIEVPVHTVSFTYDFWMDTTEVTQKHYTDVMKAGYPNYTKSGWSGTYGLGDNIPSTHMSHGDAILYCNARSNAENLDTVYTYTGTSGNPGELIELKGLKSDYSMNGYRLATEAEWEYACRGGTVTDFYWNKNYYPYPVTAADTAEISANCIWGAANSVNAELPDYAVKSGAATKKPNNYGLYDMVGGLSEWTHAGEGYFSGEAKTDPKPTTQPGDTLFIRRGGNWGNNAYNLRSANRIFLFSNYAYFFIGFRTVREVR